MFHCCNGLVSDLLMTVHSRCCCVSLLFVCVAVSLFVCVAVFDCLFVLLCLTVYLFVLLFFTVYLFVLLCFTVYFLLLLYLTVYLIVLSLSAGQPFCGVKFVSLRSGDEVHSISFKTLQVHGIEANKT